MVTKWWFFYCHCFLQIIINWLPMIRKSFLIHSFISLFIYGYPCGQMGLYFIKCVVICYYHGLFWCLKIIPVLASWSPFNLASRFFFWQVPIILWLFPYFIMTQKVLGSSCSFCKLALESTFSLRSFLVGSGIWNQDQLLCFHYSQALSGHRARKYMYMYMCIRV